MLRRFVIAAAVVLVLGGAGAYLFNRYWIHRFDPVIEGRAEIYRVDPALVWSIIHEETYFRPWKTGEAGEIGLMQITPAVGREWAAESGMRELEEQMRDDPSKILLDPEKNIEIGCWYLEKISKDYRDTPEPEARMVAAYNAGPRRAQEWNRTGQGAPPLTAEEFISRIDISSTRAYVSNVIARYRKLKANGGP